MNVGEYRFDNVKYRDINKFFLEGKLYASSIYSLKGKYILELLVPRSFFTNSFQVDDEEYYQGTLGEQWVIDANRREYLKNPLEHGDYYIEINGIKIGYEEGKRTSFRYEPAMEEVESINTVEKENNPKAEYNEDIPLKGILGVMEENTSKVPSSLEEDLNSIFKDADFQDSIVSLISSLPPLDLDNPKEDSTDFYKERELKEKSFFKRFRNSVIIPERLKNQPIVIMDLIFKSKDKSIVENEIQSLKFVYKDYRKFYTTRIDFKLPLGKVNKLIKSESKPWSEFAEKIFIEEILESKREDEPIIKSVHDNMPERKKAIYVTYEIIDNASIIPIFHNKEVINSHDFSLVSFTEQLPLKAKGANGFNRYVDFIGYIDENQDLVDFELFNLLVFFECNEEYTLI